LKNPEKYTNLGGKIPKGALLVGLLNRKKLY
jgi:ATP-dependent Zn protease